MTEVFCEHGRGAMHCPVCRADTPEGLERLRARLLDTSFECEVAEALQRLSKDIREYQRRITAAFTAIDMMRSIAVNELRPEGSKVHELMELSFARVREALNGDNLGPSPNPPGRYPNVEAFPPEEI
jgi:hypothetical protein